MLRISNYLDVPEIEEEDLLVEVFCFSVVRFDVKMLLEHPLGTGAPSVTSPVIPCIDGSGVVCEVGSNVRRFKVGDAVFFSITDQPGKAAAEWVRVPETMAALVPRGLSFKDAACLGSCASAAMEGIDWMEFKPGPGKVILVLGGATDVGSCVIRYCKYRNWEVQATAAGPEACEWCHRLGADRVINTEEADGKWAAVIKKHSIDGVFETRGAPNNFADAELVLKTSGGCFVSIAPKEGHTVADAASFLPAYLWRKIVSPFSYHCFTDYDASSQDKMDRVGKLASQGVFGSVTYGVYNFDLISVQRAFAQVAYDVVPGRPVVVIKNRVSNEKSTLRSATMTASSSASKRMFELSDDEEAGVAVVARSQTMGAGDSDARAKAKQQAEAAWATFKRWCDGINGAVEKLSAPPEGLADMRGRMVRLQAIREDVQNEGKRLYEALQRAVAQAVKVGIKVGVSEAVYKENAAQVSEGVKRAEKAISRLITKMEGAQSSTGASPSRSAESGSGGASKPLQLAAESAWAAFRKWCDKVVAAISSLQAPPEGLDDLKKRQAKIGVIKAEVLAEGKALYDAAEKAITVAVEAKVRLAGDVSLSLLKKAATEVSASVQTADKAIAKLIKKLEGEQDRQRSATSRSVQTAAPGKMAEADRTRSATAMTTAAAGSAKAKEALAKYRSWIAARLADVDGLSSAPNGLDDMRARLKKVTTIMTDMQESGKVLYDQVTSQVALLDVKEADLQAELENLANRVKKAKKAISGFVAKAEQEETSGAIVQFQTWSSKKLEQVEALTAPPRGVEDLRARARTVESIRKEVLDAGKALFEQASAAIKKSGDSSKEAQVQESMQTLTTRIKQAEKAIEVMLKREEEKLSAVQQANDAVAQLRSWCAATQKDLDALSAPPEGLEDMRARSQKIAAVKTDVLERGKALYSKAASQLGALDNSSEADLQAMMESVTSRLKGAEKAITTLLKREEEKAALEEAARGEAEQASGKLRSWCAAKMREIDALSAPPEGLDDMRARSKKAAAIRAEVVESGKALFENAAKVVKQRGDLEDLQNEMERMTERLKAAERAIAVLLGKEEEKEAQRERREREEASKRAAEEAQKRSKAQDAVDKLRAWCLAKLADIEELSSPPEGLQDLRARSAKIEEMRENVPAGRALYEGCVWQLKWLDGSVKESELQSQVKSVEERLGKADKAVSMLLKREEERVAKEESEAQRQERERADQRAKEQKAARDALAAFRNWVAELGKEMDGWTAIPDGLADLQARTAAIASAKKSSRGQQLLEACAPHLALLEVKNSALEEELSSVQERLGQAEKQVGMWLRMEQAQAEKKEAASPRPANGESANDTDAKQKVEAARADVAKLREWCDQKRFAVEALSGEHFDLDDLKDRAAKLASLKAEVQERGQALFGACNVKLLEGEVKEEELVAELRSVADKLKAAERAVAASLKKEEGAGVFKESLAVFRAWTKATLGELDALAGEVKGLADLQARLEKCATLKNDVQETGKRNFDAVVALLKDMGDTAKVTQADLETEIRAVAKRVSEAQKAISSQLKKLQKGGDPGEAAAAPKNGGSSEKASAAVAAFRAFLAAKNASVDELTNPYPTTLEGLRANEAKIDELRAEMREAGKRMYDECCLLTNNEARDELAALVKAVVEALKKAGVAFEERVKEAASKAEAEQQKQRAKEEEEKKAAEAAEAAAAIKPEPEPKEDAAVPEMDEKQAARKAQLDKIRKMKSVAGGEEASEGGEGEGKKSATERLKEKMAARQDSKKNAAAAATEETLSSSPQMTEEDGGDKAADRKNLLEKLKSRKKVATEDAGSPSTTDGAAEPPETDAADAKAADRKNLLEKLKSRKKVGDEEAAHAETAAAETTGGEEGANGTDKAADRKALLEKLKSRKKVGTEEQPATDAAEPLSADARKAALKEKMAARAATKKNLADQ